MSSFVTDLQLTRDELRQLYPTTPLEVLVPSLVAGSEITSLDPAHAEQQRLVMHCLLNRMPWAGFPSGFPGAGPGWPDEFGVAVGKCGRTGPYGVDGRPFSTARLARGEALAYLVGLARGVLGARALGDNGGGVTSFAHKQPRALARLAARWARWGYVEAVRFEMPEGKVGAFFKPTPAKALALTTAARRAGR